MNFVCCLTAYLVIGTAIFLVLGLVKVIPANIVVDSAVAEIIGCSLT